LCTGGTVGLIEKIGALGAAVAVMDIEETAGRPNVMVSLSNHDMRAKASLRGAFRDAE